VFWQENKLNEINVKFIRFHVNGYTKRIFASNLPDRDRKLKYISQLWKKWRWWYSMDPHPTPLAAHQLSRRHHAQSLLGPSFHDPKTLHLLESHLKRPAPLSRRDDQRRHTVCSRSTYALHLYIAACNPSSSARFWVLDHLCSNLSQSFRSCWITKIRSLNLCVCFYLFLFCFCCSDENGFQLWVLVCNLVIIRRSAQSWLSGKCPQTAFRPMTIIWKYFHISFFAFRQDSLKWLSLAVT